MPRLKQKIVLFIEPTEQQYMKSIQRLLKYSTPSKIGNLFTNRFCIDEDASSEVLKIYHLKYNGGPFTLEEGLDPTMLYNFDFKLFQKSGDPPDEPTEMIKGKCGGSL